MRPLHDNSMAQESRSTPIGAMDDYGTGRAGEMGHFSEFQYAITMALECVTVMEVDGNQCGVGYELDPRAGSGQHACSSMEHYVRDSEFGVSSIRNGVAVLNNI